MAHHCTRSGGKEEVLLINVVTKEKKNLVCPPSHQNRVFNPDAHNHKNSLGKILLHDGKVRDPMGVREWNAPEFYNRSFKKLVFSIRLY